LKLKNKGKDVFIYQGKDLLAKVKKAEGLLSIKRKYLFKQNPINVLINSFLFPYSMLLYHFELQR